MYFLLLSTVLYILPSFLVVADGGRNVQIDALLSSPGRFGFSRSAWSASTQAQIASLKTEADEGWSHCQYAVSQLATQDSSRGDVKSEKFYRIGV